MEQDQPHLHEIVRPLIEVAKDIGNFIVEKIIPGDVLNDLFQPPEADGDTES